MVPKSPRPRPGNLGAKTATAPTGGRGRRPFGAVGRVADVKKKLRLGVPDRVNQSQALGDSGPRGGRHSLGRGTQGSKPISSGITFPIVPGDFT